MRFSLGKAIAYVYFFVNSLGLPFGMLYTTILAPLFALSLLRDYGRHMVGFIVLLMPFFLVQLTLGIDLEVYLRSAVLLFTAFVFGLVVHRFAQNAQALEGVFQSIIRACFFFTLMAIVLYPTPLSEYLWRTEAITLNIANIRRLILFTYEASYLSTMIVPLWFYAFFKWVYNGSRNNLLQLGMITLPLVLAFSFGVISTIAIVLTFVILFNFRTMLSKPHVRNLVVVVLALGIIVVVTPNPFSTRLTSVLEGADNSGNIRVAGSMELADKIASRKSEWWGVGLGHIKVDGESVIRNEWKIKQTETVRLPNTMAEYVASMGWVGLCLRLVLTMVLFFYSRVARNNFQLALFLFMLIYQFTGSFMTNVAEAVIWALAARHVFTEMDSTLTKTPTLTTIPAANG